jgi:hypothetical protein
MYARRKYSAKQAIGSFFFRMGRKRERGGVRVMRRRRELRYSRISSRRQE